MTYPAFAELQTSFTAFQQSQGDNSFPGSPLDIDLANLKTSVDGVNHFLRGVTRADGRLANGSVGQEQLAAGLMLGIEPPTGWLTATAYAQMATVFTAGGYYQALVAHTSTTFEADLAAGYWLALIDFAPYIQEGVDDAIESEIGEAAGDAVDDAINSSKLVAQVESTTALNGVEALGGRSIRLTDDLREAAHIWDAAITPAQYALDPEGLIYVVPNPGSDGAWVNPLADRRRGYWANSATPARKARVNSGLFVGSDAVTYLGATAGNNGDTEFWVHSAADGRGGSSSWGYLVNNAMNMFARDNGQINTSVVTRTAANAAAGTIGFITAVLGRNADPEGSAWAMYSDAVALPGHAAHMRVGEFNIVACDPISNTGGELPYTTIQKGLRFVFGLAAGGDANIWGSTNDVDEAVRFSNNGARFNTGLMFRSNSLVLDGSSEGRAIAMGKGHSFVWYATGDVETARIVCNATANPMWRQAFGDTVLSISRGGNLAFVVEPAASSTNHLRVLTTNGGAVTVRAQGGNVDLELDPGGTGVLKIGYETTAASVAANFSATRYLAVKDTNGTTLYIPCRTTVW
jgi:hypothetical protein